MSDYMSDDSRAGKPGEAFFYAHVNEILNCEVVSCEKLKQLAHHEGDYLVNVSTPENKSYVVEVKTDASCGLLEYGNMPVQLANDGLTELGWIADIQDASKRHVDMLTYIFFADRDCTRPYAAVTVGVDSFVKLLGCPGEPGCLICDHPCPKPGSIEWKIKAFRGVKKIGDSLGLINLFDKVIKKIRTRIIVFDALDDCDLSERQRRTMERLVHVADVGPTVYINTPVGGLCYA